MLGKPSPYDLGAAELFRPVEDGVSQEVIMAHPEQVDMLVLGSGEASTYLASHLAHAGQRTAVVER